MVAGGGRDGDDERGLLGRGRELVDPPLVLRALRREVPELLRLVVDDDIKVVPRPAVAAEQLLELVRGDDQPAVPAIAERREGVPPGGDGDLGGPVDGDQRGAALPLARKPIQDLAGREHRRAGLADAGVIRQQEAAVPGGVRGDDRRRRRELLLAGLLGDGRRSGPGRAVELVLRPARIGVRLVREGHELRRQLLADIRVGLDPPVVLRSGRGRAEGHLEHPDMLARSRFRNVGGRTGLFGGGLAGRWLAGRGGLARGGLARGGRTTCAAWHFASFRWCGVSPHDTAARSAGSRRSGRGRRLGSIP